MLHQDFQMFWHTVTHSILIKVALSSVLLWLCPSLITNVFICVLSFEQAFAFYGQGSFLSFFFFFVFISAFICINSFLLLSFSLFYNSFSGFWSCVLHLFMFSLSCLLVNTVELLAIALPLFHGFDVKPSSSSFFLKR